MVETEPVDRPLDALKIALLHVRLDLRPQQRGIERRGTADRETLYSNTASARAAAGASAGVDGQAWLVIVDAAHQAARHARANRIDRGAVRKIDVVDRPVQHRRRLEEPRFPLPNPSPNMVKIDGSLKVAKRLTRSP